MDTIYFDIKLKIINELGTFVSSSIEISVDRYPELVELSKLFWITESSFSLTTDNGEVIFPPEILAKSILIIEKC